MKNVPATLAGTNPECVSLERIIENLLEKVGDFWEDIWQASKMLIGGGDGIEEMVGKNTKKYKKVAN